jgi:hypothetical protein
MIAQAPFAPFRRRRTERTSEIPISRTNRLRQDSEKRRILQPVKFGPKVFDPLAIADPGFNIVRMAKWSNEDQALLLATRVVMTFL